MSAPGPWARLQEAAEAVVDAEAGYTRQRATDTMRAVLSSLPSPREADAAGEALALLYREWIRESGKPEAVAFCRDAEALLRRAGRLS